VAVTINPLLGSPPGVPVFGYGDLVLDRFADPAIAHRTRQVAMAGTRKLPQHFGGMA
jgi:fructuronate reductase